MLLDFYSREGKINKMQQRINDNLKLAKEAGRLAVLNHEERCVAVIETLKKYRHSFRKGSGQQYLCLIDAIGFGVLYDLDITTLQAQVMYAETSWPQNLNGRLLAMTIWECINDLPKLCGREFREAVAELTFADDLRGKLGIILKEMNKFKIRNQSSLTDIRNNVAAHRDHDLENFFSGLKKADPKQLCDLARSLSRLLGDFEAAMLDVLRQAHQLTKFARVIATLKPS